MGFSFYDLFEKSSVILQEAEDDNTEQTPSNNGGEQQADQGGDDDFDIDTSLDDDQQGGEEEGGDAEGGDVEQSEEDAAQQETQEEEEPVQANTDMFSSLSAEEQKLKIIELKKQYNDLYVAIDDEIGKINDISTDENTIEVVSRSTEILTSLKHYLSDYMINVFPSKSVYENDVKYNEILAIISSVSTALDRFSTIEKKKNEDK